MGWRWLPGLASLVCAGALSAASAQAPLDGYHLASSVTVPCDGSAIATPPLKGRGAADYRIVLSGTFTFAYNGTTYDAFYGPDGAPHRYVRTDPPDLVRVEEDRRAHRYVLGLSEGVSLAGSSVTVAIDTSRFVDDFLITPSEVKQALTGGLKVELYERPGPAAGAMARVPAGVKVAVIGLLAFLALMVGIGLPIAAYARRAGDELRVRLSRIDAKVRRASRSAAARGGFFAELVKQLADLQAAAHRLGNLVRESDRTLRTVHRDGLERDVRSLDQRLESATDAAVRGETERALVQKRAALAALDTVGRRREEAMLRLTKLEGTLDATLLKIPDIELKLAGEENEDAAISAIESELELIRKVTEEIRLEGDPTRLRPAEGA